MGSQYDKLELGVLLKRRRVFLQDSIYKNLLKFAFIVSETKKCPGFLSTMLGQIVLQALSRPGWRNEVIGQTINTYIERKIHLRCLSFANNDHSQDFFFFHSSMETGLVLWAHIASRDQKGLTLGLTFCSCHFEIPNNF